MTRQTDKLVAIRGIADIFAETRDIKYTAGIINSSEEYFIQGLLWSSSKPGNRLLNISPWWSWASVECEVGWLALYCVDFQPSTQTLDIKIGEQLHCDRMVDWALLAKVERFDLSAGPTIL